MRILRLTAALAALALSASIAAAQQPTPPPRPDRYPGGMMGPEGMATHMQMMDSLNARLDTLVHRMNRAAGERKVTAMAEVITELVAQRKVMHQHMGRMMHSRNGLRRLEVPGPRSHSDTSAHPDGTR